MSPWRWQELFQFTLGDADIALLGFFHASGVGDTCYLLLEKGMWRSASLNYQLVDVITGDLYFKIQGVFAAGPWYLLAFQPTAGAAQGGSHKLQLELLNRHAVSF